MKFKVKLLQGYGDYKAGDICEVDIAEDMQTLIDGGIAEKYVPKVDINLKGSEENSGSDDEDTSNVDDLEAIAKKIGDEVRKGLKDEFKAMIPAQAKDNKEDSPWDSIGSFFKSIVTGKSDEKLYQYCKVTGMGTIINADGGFLIPQEYSLVLLDQIKETAILQPKTMNFPINNNLTLPYVNRTSMASSWTGGVTIYKNAESVAATSSKPQLGACALNLHKMTALVYVTDELLQDSPVALETFLSSMVGKELALTVDEDIVNGSGAGEALGIMNAPALINVTAQPGQAANTIVFENALAMYKRLYTFSRQKALWLINQDCVDQIATFVINVGTGGAPVMIANAATKIPEALFGIPIEWSPHCQTLGTSGDIILADLSQYITTTKAGRTIESATSIHVKFVEGETAFRFTMRSDGQPWWSSAVTPKHGTSTVSPFVSLESRT